MQKLLCFRFPILSFFLVLLSEAVYSQCALNCPENVKTTATSGQGAVVNYTTPTIPKSCNSQTFAFTGEVQTFTVPAGVTSIRVKIWGAQGGETFCADNGGLGGYAEGTLSVIPGSNFSIYVGGKPQTSSGDFDEVFPGGFNGGGSSGSAAGGGGGASDVRGGDGNLTDRLIVAGGGGGGSGYSVGNCPAGGAGGGTSGNHGTGTTLPNGTNAPGGGGGTQASGGSAGYNGQAGSLGNGGGSIFPSFLDSGGGGGYYGGGSSNASGGGGGSSYIGGVTDGSMQTGINSGHGKVEIAYNQTLTPTLTQTAGLASGETFPVGTTTNTFQLNDGAGNITACSFTVTVEKLEKLELTCPIIPVQCYRLDCNYTLPELKVSNPDLVASVTYTITGATSRTGSGLNASGKLNLGTSTITWTVTDEGGNESTCQSTVTVNKPLVAYIPDAKANSKGVQENTVYRGYDPAGALTLKVNVIGGTSPYSYKWSTNATTQSIQVKPGSTCTYKVVITDAKGCTTVAWKTVKVVDVRCGSKNDKVEVCHKDSKGKRSSLCVSKKDVASHLNHGDYLGSCRRSNAADAVVEQEIGITAEPTAFTVRVLGNPSPNHFTLVPQGGNQETMAIRVMDAAGRVVESRTNVAVAGAVELGHGYRSGLYLVEVVQGRQRVTLKLVKSPQ